LTLFLPMRERRSRKEVYRILKTKGIALFQVPYRDGETYEDPGIQSPPERRVAFGQEDHVRIYGYLDFIDRLIRTGFKVTPTRYAKQLGAQVCSKYVLDEEEVIFICRKKNSGS